MDDKKREEISVSGVNDVVMILKSDYENAYFVTGTLLPLENFVLIEQVKKPNYEEGTISTPQNEPINAVRQIP